MYQINVNLIEPAGSDKIETDLVICDWRQFSTITSSSSDSINMVNSFIVKPGNTVAIPVKDAYRAWSFYDDFGKTPIPSGDVTAELVWQDGSSVNGTMQYVFNSSNDITVVNPTLRDKAYIKVTPHREGNAVVAMKVGGVIYWSWHIWCTAYNPDAYGSSVWNENGSIVMTRDLGSLDTVYTPEGKERGLLYQYGRKDPFTTGENWTTDNKNDINGNVKNLTFSSSDNSDKTRIADAVHNPFTFFTRTIITGQSGSWCPFYPDFIKLWFISRKGLYDPCPAGWRVPVETTSTRPFYIKGAGFYVDAVNKCGFNSAYPKHYYPFSYMRDNTGTLTKEIYTVWMAITRKLNVAPSYISTAEYTANGSLQVPVSGRAIRCVKDDY